MDKSMTGTQLLRNRLRGVFIHRAMSRDMRDSDEGNGPATGDPEVRLVGLDPIRVLVIGSGLGVAYGVRTQAETLTGALAEAIRSDGERGVVVQNRATDRVRIEQTVAALGDVGATACNVVVWCPSLLDLLRSPDRGRYHRALMDGIRILRETARPGAEIILCGLPVPTRKGPAEEFARSVVPRFNAGLARAAAALSDVQVAEAPSLTSPLDPEALSADYYRRVAAEIVDVLGDLRPV